MRKCLGVALSLFGFTATAEPLTYIRSMPLISDLPTFGGISAIEMQNPGIRAMVLSDRGAAFTITLDRTAQSYVIAAVQQPQPHRDSEGLAQSDKHMFFSYEGPAEVWRADKTRLPRHPDFAAYPPNGSLEALAAAPDGTLYALPEQSGGRRQPFPIYRFFQDGWQIIGRLPQRGPFLPAGADIGPQGRLYILERAFSLLGFRSRVRRIDLENPDAEAETLLTTGPGVHDNLEGLAVWRSRSGATCLTFVSDNNFLPIQRTEWVEYALTETLARGAHCD